MGYSLWRCYFRLSNRKAESWSNTESAVDACTEQHAAVGEAPLTWMWNPPAVHVDALVCRQVCHLATYSYFREYTLCLKGYRVQTVNVAIGLYGKLFPLQKVTNQTQLLLHLQSTLKVHFADLLDEGTNLGSQGSQRKGSKSRVEQGCSRTQLNVLAAYLVSMRACAQRNAKLSESKLVKAAQQIPQVRQECVIHAQCV